MVLLQSLLGLQAKVYIQNGLMSEFFRRAEEIHAGGEDFKSRTSMFRKNGFSRIPPAGQDSQLDVLCRAQRIGEMAVVVSSNVSAADWTFLSFHWFGILYTLQTASSTFTALIYGNLIPLRNLAYRQVTVHSQVSITGFY